VRKLVVSEFVSLDGVMEDPGGAEGFDRGGWAFKFERGPDGDQFKLDELLDSDVLLLGRTTYEGFAAAWPTVTDEVGFADKMNSMAKVVVSTTLQNPTWNNSRVVSDNVPETLLNLKRESGGNILVAGSRTLVQTLIEHRLVDEFRLMVFPIVLGAGQRLFPQTGAPIGLELVEAKPVGGGIVTLVYASAPTAPAG
jgi:dihydrofolate reductase